MHTEESFGIVPLRKLEGSWSVFIILHKLGNHWGFPKGKRESNETALESAIRELREETGLKVETLLSPEPFIEKYHFFRRQQKIYKTSTYFSALVSGAYLLQMEEIADGGWMPIENALALLTFDQARAMLKQVLLLLPNDR